MGQPDNEYERTVLLETFAKLDVVLANIWISYTFRGRNLASIVDIRKRVP